MNIEFLPRGEFIITTTDGKKVNGRMCYWSQKRFCQKLNIPLKEMHERIFVNLTLDDIVEFILTGIEYTFVKDGRTCPYNDLIVSDWIEDSGGMSSLNNGWFNKLLNHGFPKTETEVEEEEKKNIVETLHGRILNEPALPQDLNQESITNIR